MPQMASTILLRGGMNMVSPPVSVPPGQCTAAVNYEPEVSGYRRIGGYERFDGRTAPSAGGTRANILTVPGTGNVLGVWCYAGSVWAFRKDASADKANMYKATSGGWVLQTFGHLVPFKNGTAAFVEGETFTSSVNSRTGTVKRIVLSSGSYSAGDAFGYMVVSNLSGILAGNEVLTGSASGSVTVAAPVTSTLKIGYSATLGVGPYQFVNHNFYGQQKSERMYFCTGGQVDGHAFEWDGTTLTPVHSYQWEGDPFPGQQTEIIKPSFIGQFRNHLVLGVNSSLIISGIGEPLDYRASAGASEIAFGEVIKGFTPSLATAFVVFGKARISYLAGNDSDDFQLLPITSDSGAFFGTVAPFGESPLYLDDSGVRKISTAASFGDFRMGTLTQLIEPLFRTKRKAGVAAVAALTIRGKDQYRLFFDDNSGVIVYMGRKNPESMPFIYPMQVYCASSGEVTATAGERHFVGAEDGFVYELDSGTSFDGAAVSAFIRMNWNSLQSPNQMKRFHSASIETDSEDTITVGMAFHVDYAIADKLGGAKVDHSIAAGSTASGFSLQLGADMVTNGTFATDTGWTKGTGVTIAAGVATFTTVADAVLGLSQSASITLTAGRTYKFEYAVSGYSAGGVRARFGGGTAVLGTTRTANGTYTEFLTAVTGNVSVGLLTVGATTLNIDNLSVQELSAYNEISPVQGVLKAHIDGIGRNIAIELVTSHTDEEPHVISTLTVNFSPRNMVR